MTAQLRAELLKLRSTRTIIGLFAAMIGLVAFAVALHALTLGADSLDTRSVQTSIVYGWGERFGALIAALLGAMSITGEIRYGTIRPTFIVTPQRTHVITGKVVTAMLAGTALGLIGAVFAVGFGSVALAARGIEIRLDTGDFVLFIAGATAAAALWAAIGVGLGALLRSQVPTLVGITAWLLIVESLLVENIASVGRFGPGAAGQALSGQGTDLLAPVAAVLVLATYAAAAIGAGVWTITHRDIT